MNPSDFSIIICYEKGFLLPVFNKAFDSIIGKYNHLKDRYLGAIILSSSDKAMTIVEVVEVEKIASFFFGLVTTKSRISFVTKELHEDREYIYRKLSEAASSSQSYSVWGQFYDSKKDLKSAILDCSNFTEVTGVLNIAANSDISTDIL